MRSSTYVALFAGSTAAQSAVTLMNFFPYESTLTQIGSDATATTYTNVCSSGHAGFIPSSILAAASATITPAPQPRSRVVRQAGSSDEFDQEDEAMDDCVPFLLMQGASTYEFHLTDSLPGAWTANMNCNWKGAITAADITCTETNDGFIVDSTERGVVSTSIILKEEIASWEVLSAVTIETSSGAASVSASRTLSSGFGSASASRTPSSGFDSAVAAAVSGTAAFQSSASASRSATSGVSVSVPGSAVSAPSSGFAAAGPLPTGAIALVGGAAGIFAAALAL